MITTQHHVFSQAYHDLEAKPLTAQNSPEMAAPSSAGARSPLHLAAMTHSRKFPDFQCDRTIVLVGMMGAGKTTVGRRLAPQIGLPFFDADSEIERAAGMSVAELFKRHGEKSFRQGEAKVIERLLGEPPGVIATGGGAVLDAETRRHISEKAVSIWIKADIDTIVRRATRRRTRPLLKTGDPHEIITKLLNERTEFYAAANIHIDTQPGPHINTVNLIIEMLGDYLDIAPTTSARDNPNLEKARHDD